MTADQVTNYMKGNEIHVQMSRFNYFTNDDNSDNDDNGDNSDNNDSGDNSDNSDNGDNGNNSDGLAHATGVHERNTLPYARFALKKRHGFCAKAREKNMQRHRLRTL